MLSDVAVKFGVAVNILHGKIEYIGERALGILVVQLTAPHQPVSGGCRGSAYSATYCAGGGDSWMIYCRI
ncbi:NIL domain [Citrobacter koseri]|uniref:NIL domain n=1 Tax=Citrobacter koseri TaxID=545 RepID=A0A2X2X6F8_CITKO|nr:NIL domain [Citrobacter koseri]